MKKLIIIIVLILLLPVGLGILGLLCGQNYDGFYAGILGTIVIGIGAVGGFLLHKLTE
jgi:hypothetical protein